MYEVYLRSHFGVTAVGSLALWRHIALQKRPSRLYIVGGLIMWTVVLAWRVLATLYRNLHLTGHHWLPRVDVRSTDSDSNRLENVCHAEVVGCRPWTVKPGQYVYLWVPGVSLTSPFQSHPFWVIWWDVDDKHHLVLYLLIREGHGFTSRLLSQCDQRFRAAISGPFGRSVEVDKFGTVLMFATDIGIASHIPYIKSLLEGRDNSEICTRRILVVWQIQRSGKCVTDANPTVPNDSCRSPPLDPKMDQRICPRRQILCASGRILLTLERTLTRFLDVDDQNPPPWD